MSIIHHHFFNRITLPKGLRWLYGSTLIRQAAKGFLSMFGVIFLYQQLQEKAYLLVISFLILFILYILLLPWISNLLQKMGLRNMMISALIINAAHFVGFIFLQDITWLLVSQFIVSIVIFKCLFWVPYNVEFAELTDSKTRASQMGILLNLSTIVLTLAPIAGGYIIENYGFASAFWIGTFLYMLAAVPLFFVPMMKEKFSYSYIETFKKLFAPNTRPLLISFAGFGVQDAVHLVFWPVFIYNIFNGDYVKMGIITAVAMVVIMALRLLVGYIDDTRGKKQMLRFGAWFEALGWIAKAFVVTGFHVFAADIFHNIGKSMNRITFMATFFDQAADNGHYVDEFSALKAMAQSLGRVIMLLIGLVIVMFNSFTIAFIIAGIASLAVTALGKAYVHLSK